MALLLVAYVLYAGAILDLTWPRFVAGFGHGACFISRMLPPNFAADKLQLLQHGMSESPHIAILATPFGIALSLPLGLAAARNLSSAPLAWTSRTRSLHPVLVAILFVKGVGFGALAGVLALTVAPMGFLSELLADASRKCRCGRWKPCAPRARLSSPSW